MHGQIGKVDDSAAGVVRDNDDVEGCSWGELLAVVVAGVIVLLMRMRMRMG